MLADNVTFPSLPDTPGVYFFIGKRREILYIGKATSLRNRVRSYFSGDLVEKRSSLIAQMVAETQKIEVTETDSVLEALLLETNLIRTHKPRYNTVSKDDKSFNHLIITREEFPRVLVVRGKDMVQYPDEILLHHFGPFPQGTLFKEALHIIRKLFQFYDVHAPTADTSSKFVRGKIDFNRQIGLYPDEQSKAVYARTIKHIALFFSGEKAKIITDLERAMMLHAKKMEFEEAHELKRKIFALKHIHDVALIKDEMRTYRDDRQYRIEAYDVAHLQGSNHVGVMTVVISGERRPSEYRTFTIKTVQGANDVAALSEILGRRLEHTEWDMPALIVVDGGTQQRNAAQKVLDHAGVVIPLAAVVKDEKHRPKRVLGARSIVALHHDAILLANAESHRFAINTHRKKRKIV